MAKRKSPHPANSEINGNSPVDQKKKKIAIATLQAAATATKRFSGLGLTESQA